MLISVIQAAFAKKGWRKIMAKAKKLVRRAWTKDDVRQMKTMAKAKSGVRKIAKALKRTPGATGVMAAKLRISLSMRD
jgi:divalent metal cation (Fe/Co/Zn/Cd) transporter